VLSTHLARSYHHLFPLKGWVEVPWSEASKSAACFACLAPFPVVPRGKVGKGKGTATAAGEKGVGGVGVGVASAVVAPEIKTAGVSESGRYACTVCGHHFCIDCDVFAHEIIHNCPGCQSDSRVIKAHAEGNGEEANGQGQKKAGADEAMVIDS
jgi:transcription initiation factor TFIIH subunit 2